ncbi:Bug family tripartite tricarboxylate transporter substrate binding protein [Thermodesulfobacteriota bacterium]
MDFPKKSITIVINLAPGGGLDLTTRLFAQYLQKDLGVPVIIKNIVEGGGKKGVQEVFEAKADGYTLLSNLETRNIQSELAFHSPYKILEFTPIICLTKVDLVIVARKDAPFNNLSELKALSKKKIINASTTGVGSLTHLLVLRLKKEGDISMEPIPFKGSALGLTSLIGGHVDLTVTDMNSAKVHLEKLKMICTFGGKRSKFFPDIPTALEQGFNIVVEDTIGILAPPKLPKEIASMLEIAFANLRRRSEVKEKIKQFGRILSDLSSEEYHKKLRQTYENVGKYKSIFE